MAHLCSLLKRLEFGFHTFIFIRKLKFTVIMLVHLLILLMGEDQVLLALVDMGFLRFPAPATPPQAICVTREIRARWCLNSL